MCRVARNSLLLLLILAPVALWVCFHGSPLKPRQGQAAQPPAPKYIFIFLADGAGITHLEITRQYNRHLHNEGLIISDRIMGEGSLGLLTTHSADSLSTDSAAAGTALASAVRPRTARLAPAKTEPSRKQSWR